MHQIHKARRLCFLLGVAVLLLRCNQGDCHALSVKSLLHSWLELELQPHEFIASSGHSIPSIYMCPWLLGTRPRIPSPLHVMR